jgi:glycosyltransferase involved in cell wall biosynthesis
MDFFRRLAARYGSKMRVYYSPQDMGALTNSHARDTWEYPIGSVLNPINGVEWQVGALSVPIQRGDTVIVCGAPRQISTLLLLAKSRFKGARTIWWGQYWSATTKPQRHRLRMKLSRLANALLFYTDAEVERFNTDGWSHPGPVSALNNGIDVTEVRHLRQSYDPVKRGKNLLFIGRLTDKASLDLLFSAMGHPILADVHLHVIGKGEKEQQLRQLADSKAIQKRITWHGETIEEAEIAEVANNCAAFVYPGQVGLSLIHSMAYGLPSVVHREAQRQMPEFAAFTHGKTGVSFEIGSDTALATAIASLLTERDLRLEMSKTCIKVVEKKYTTENMAERFEAYFEKFIASGAH